ncbi:MAG TPA: alpha/beta fold hydrolase [Thermoanaerobaculia bacterium]|nr:alpha/beta fold hydrolase [Thermoanaerobaculia bacterium]
MLLLLIFAFVSNPIRAAEEKSLEDQVKDLARKVESLEYDLDQVRKLSDDAQFWLRLSDVAEVDKVILTGPPNPKGEETYGIANTRHPLRIYLYTFLPKNLDKSRKHPAIMLTHGGVHGDFGTYHMHLVREMLERGYIVLAPEYRGSTGYGREMYEAIDYGGLENDDIVASRDWAVEQLPVDPKRIALVGWSHGGMISLMAGFDHPDKFACIYAGVPVSDLITRLGYHDQGYNDLFSADYHIGKRPSEAVDEYRKRSPIWNVEKLKLPLMVTSTTNDRDVNVVEVQQLIVHLKAAGKSFEHKIYDDAPGGHSFDRIDTTYARNARKDLYAFLDQHLR